MAITRTPQIDDDGTGTTGTIWNNAWKQELYDQIDAFGLSTLNNPTQNAAFNNLTLAGTLKEYNRAYAQGVWKSTALGGANFSSNIGSWTVPTPPALQWTAVGLTAFLGLSLATNSTIAGGPTQLLITLPAGFALGGAGLYAPVARMLDGAGALVRAAISPLTATQLAIVREDFAAFANGGGCQVYVTLFVPVASVPAT